MMAHYGLRAPAARELSLPTGHPLAPRTALGREGVASGSERGCVG
jgi:hypothetical protein